MRVSARNKTILLAICVLLCFLLSASVVWSALSVSVTISLIGQISSIITAKSGSPTDVQAAINTAHSMGGGTVNIPAGTWNYDNISQTGFQNNLPTSLKSYGGVNITGAGQGQTILKWDSNLVYTGNPSMLSVDGSNGLPFTISNITFQGYFAGSVDDENNYGTTGIDLVNCKDYRVTNCTVDSFTSPDIDAVMTSNGHWNRGVIDHCNLTQTYKLENPSYKWGYGTIVWDHDTSAWSSDSSIIGQYNIDTMFLENNTYYYCRHCASNSQNGYYVMRYCTIHNEQPPNFGSIDVHGYNGGRGCEAYNNTVYATGGYGSAQAIWLRGGTNTVFNNTFVNIYVGVTLMNDGASYGHTGNNGTAWLNSVWDTYIWGNTLVGGGTAFSNTDGRLTENVDYFLYARPSYVPYVYPNPLDTG